MKRHESKLTTSGPAQCDMTRDVNDNLKHCFLLKIQGTAHLKHVFYYPVAILDLDKKNIVLFL